MHFPEMVNWAQKLNRVLRSADSLFIIAYLSLRSFILCASEDFMEFMRSTCCLSVLSSSSLFHFFIMCLNFI